MNNSDNPHQEQIKDLIQKIEALTIETSQLTQELNRLQETVIIPYNSPDTQETNTGTTNSYHIGDRVIITNSYLGKKGTRGTVTATSAKQVTLIDRNGKEYKRRYTNIRYE